MLLADCKNGARGRVAGFFGKEHTTAFYESRGITAGTGFTVVKKYGSYFVVRFGDVVFGMDVRTAMEIRVIRE